MNNQIKTAFLIIRVTEEFKKRIVKKAKSKGESLSVFLRRFLDKIK